MSQVEVVVTGTVQAPPAPLVITPTADTLENVFSGVPYPETVIATVKGGVQPYSYQMDPNLGSVPNGLTLDENAGPGIIGISGTPSDPAGTAINFGVIVTDAAGAQAQVAVKSSKKIG
jgi:hypothetical protein